MSQTCLKQILRQPFLQALSGALSAMVLQFVFCCLVRPDSFHSRYQNCHVPLDSIIFGTSFARHVEY